MKKIYNHLFILAVFLGIAVLLSFANGYAKEKTGGLTKAPGDLELMNGTKETCAKCHNGNQFESSVEIFVTDANNHNILGYNPGAPYTIHVKINHSKNTPSGYGFQMVGLTDKDDQGLQNFPSWSENVQEITGILGRRYYEHDGISASNEFTIDWVAPNNGAGSVTFYAVGNAVNSNNSNSGDAPCNTKLTLTEGLLLNNNTPSSISNFQILGNPSLDFINLSISAKKTLEATFNLYNLTGQQILSVSQSLSSGKNNVGIDVSEVKTGAYFLTIQTADGQIAKKIMIH